MSFSSFELLDHSKPMLVFGRDGQVGKALQVCLKDLKIPVVFLGRDECDLANVDSIRQVLNHYQPQVIINAAAYTAVDKAEGERELAFAINTLAPKVMAQYATGVDHGVLVHYSTDYVFADTQKTPYFEADQAGPIDQLCLYGKSKLAGEEAIKDTFNLVHDSGDAKYQDRFSKYLILRTSWVYGDGENFIRKILQLTSDQTQIKVVDDQMGVPTSAEWLAAMSVKMIDSNIESGIYHVVPDGETSWHGLAALAIETAQSEGADGKLKNIIPVVTEDHPTLAKRPLNSRLNNTKFKKALSEIGFEGQYPHWQNQVKAYIKENIATSLKYGEFDEGYLCQ